MAVRILATHAVAQTFNVAYAMCASLFDLFLNLAHNEEQTCSLHVELDDDEKARSNTSRHTDSERNRAEKL